MMMVQKFRVHCSKLNGAGLVSALMMLAATSGCATSTNVSEPAKEAPLRLMDEFKEADGEWTAFGYLTPTPTSEPRVIGVFKFKRDCLRSADAWMARQVVGNPVFAECLPVDRK